MIGTRPAPQPRQPRRLFAPLVVAALFLFLTVATAAAPALAAGKAKAEHHGGGARIDVLSPRPAGRVDGKALDVRLRVSTTAGFRATVGGHDVSRRFRRAGSLLEAHLRRGRDFRLGENALLIATGRGHSRSATTAYFVARRRTPGLLAVTRLPAHGGTPLRFRIHAASPIGRLKVTLNHHRYRFGPLGDHRSWTIAVGAEDGLRYGQNTLRATAERVGAERFDRETTHFRVDRSAPLVSAGPDSTTRSGRAVVLDGTSTQAGTREGSLLYRWKIVKQPRGSHAKIVNPTGRTARLLPDLPGSYKVRLVAARAGAEAVQKSNEMEAEATASSVTTPEPVCLPNVPVALTPAGESEPAAEESGSSEALTPLEAPVCVIPTGETTPPLPLEAITALAADETEVTAKPTGAPMGWPIETIASDGSIRVGPQIYPKGGSNAFARYVVLSYKDLQPESEGTVSLENPGALTTVVENASIQQIVVISGMGVGHSQAPAGAQEALAKSFSKLDAKLPEGAAEREAIIKKGDWSVVGVNGDAGSTYANLQGASEQTPVETKVGSLPGSVNGHLEPVRNGTYSYVSAEFIPIDTRAPGSSTTLSVFKVGEEAVTSQPIQNGSLALHIAVFDGEGPNGKLAPLANNTYVVVFPGGGSNVQGVREAAEDLQHWREAPGNDLIVMQTVGEEAVGQTTGPWGAPNWVNDALFHPTENGLFEWNGQPYVKVKKESEVKATLNSFWNQQYPTVAGQVGDLTGPAGHDLVADFGGGNAAFRNVNPVEVSRLTMVANNHAQNPEANYVNASGEGYNVTKEEQEGRSGTSQAVTHQAPEGRLVGMLVRNTEGGFAVQNGVPAANFAPSGIYARAYAEPTPWPDSEGNEDNAAMKAIIVDLFGKSSPIKSLRENYTSSDAEYWTARERELERLPPQESSEFSEATFIALRNQLTTETREVARVKNAIEEWKRVFVAQGQYSALVQTQTISSKILDEVIKDAKNQEKVQAEINPAAIIADSLFSAAGIIGFPEVYAEAKIPQTIGLIAGGISLAEASTPETTEAKQQPETAVIRDKANLLGGDLAKYLENVNLGLTQLEKIIVSDWGKLSKAGPEAISTWQLGEATGDLQLSMSVNIAQQLYEALLPSAFEEWVVSPYDTKWNGAGPQIPPNQYACWSYHGSEGQGAHLKHPLKDEPIGGISTALYRPWNPPGSSTSPAQPYTAPYSIRALKSTSDKMKMSREQVSETQEAVSVYHDGSSPKGRLINELFESTPSSESLTQPHRLGLNKVEFFANYGGGLTTFKRTICAEQ